MYAVTVPSEPLLNGLRVVTDSISNVIDDRQLPINAPDVQSDASLTTADVETNTSAPDGTTSHDALESSRDSMLKESCQPNSERSSTDPDYTEVVDVPVTSSSATDSEHGSEQVNGSKSCSPLTALAPSAVSVVNSPQGSICVGITSGESLGLADINNEIVTRSAAVQSTNGAVLTSFSGMHDLPQVTDIRSSPTTISNVVTNNQFDTPTGSAASQFSVAVLGSADVLSSIMSPFVSSAVLPGDLSVRSESTSGENTDIPPTAISRQAQQHGVKRKPVSHTGDECSSKTKISRIDSQKRISKYICPPPDSASDKDSKIIHVMDRFCDTSLQQYVYSGHGHVSDCNAVSQQRVTGFFQSSSQDHVSMVDVLPIVSAHHFDSSVKYPAGLNASNMLGNLNHEHVQTAAQFSSLGTQSMCSSQSQISHIHLHGDSSRADGVPASHGKGFTLANFLSTTTTPSVLITSLSQQSSLPDSTEASKNDQIEHSSSLLAEPFQSQNNFIPGKISTSSIACDTASNILPDDLNLTDNDFAMILSDTDDSSMFSIPSRKSVDNSYWSLGFGSVCGRLRDRAKDGHGIESLHASTEDLCQLVVPMFREQTCVPETDYLISEHTDLGSKVGFNVSSLTCKTTSVCRTYSSVQIANSFTNNTSNALCQTSGSIPLSYLLVSQNNDIILHRTSSDNKLQEASNTQASNAMCSTVQSSARGIFSLAHHAVQPAPKSFIPNSSRSNEVAQSATVLWSPCNGNVHKSSLSSDAMLSEHRQSLNVGRQCRRPSSTITDMHWHMPEPSNLGPLYNSWSCTVQPLARPRPFVDQTVNAQPGACNMQSKPPFPKIHSVAETDRGKLHGRWSDGDFCPFISNKNTSAPSKHVSVNCQYSSHEKVPDSGGSQPLWTYSECGIAPQSYLSTSRGWMPTGNSDSNATVTFDLSLTVPATSCLSASTCRLPSFSFATVPPVPDFLSLNFATTVANTNTAAGTGSEVSTWPVTLTATTASINASHSWSPIFPQYTAFQSRNIVSTSSSSVASLTTVSGTQRHDTHPDVTYTVPSFTHTDKESRKQPSSFNTHLPSYTLWQGTEHVPVEMSHLPPVSMMNSDAQLLPIHRRGLYSSSEPGFISNTLTSPPLHHHPMYCSQQAGIRGTGENQVTFETPFALPRLPLTSQVLNFNASFETVPPAASAISSDTYHDPAFNVGNMAVQIRTTEEDARRSQNAAQSQRPANSKRPSKYSKQLKHNATSLCASYRYPTLHNSALSQSVAADIPTYLPAGPFVGRTLDQKSSSSEYQVGVSFGSVFGSCSFRHGLAGEFPKSFGVTTTSDPQATVSLPNQRHNFDIGAFISELSSSSLQAVTAPAAIRRLDFPTPPVHVLQQPVGPSEHYQLQMECHQSHLPASDHASQNFGLHNMSINSLLGDHPYSGFTHRYEVYSDTANHATSTLPAFDVPTLNFSIRSQTPAVSCERPHNTKARRTQS